MSMIDAVELFTRTIDYLKKGKINLLSPLEKIVIGTCGNDLAYIDNRRDAKQNYSFDFWANLSEEWLKSQGVGKNLLYSESQQFPDFLFKTKKRRDNYVGGSLIELKDSKSGSIASFNSTIPTKFKSLEEIDVINGRNLVSRIAKIMDRELADSEEYFTFDRRCFYLVRTYNRSTHVKVSVVDGSFFETIPKESLFYQMFLNVLRAHLRKEKIEIPQSTLTNVEETLSHITDQTIIAGSQMIEGASVRPRLRIMAEVHTEGNPHSRFYPEISEGSFNLILKSSPDVKEVEAELSSQIPEITIFPIHHMRNGEHVVFQYKKETKLNRYL
jgi:hypothetical protein